MTETLTNPFGEFRTQCESLLRKVMLENLQEVAIPSIFLVIPPNPDFGELTYSNCFEIARQIKKNPLDIARQIADEAQKKVSNFPFVATAKAEGQGYVNFYINLSEFAQRTLVSAHLLDNEYGYVNTKKPLRILVEHTSANPVHPIHIGTSRNSVLGDALARLFTARGHEVSRHYYVDDVGRQSAIIAYGYKLLGKPKYIGKPDHFIGNIYSVTTCLLEISRIEETIRKGVSDNIAKEEVQKLQEELDEWISVAEDLKERFPDIFTPLLERISQANNPELEINLLLREYEAGNDATKDLISEFSQNCIKGFKMTFARAGISVDSWDWESTFVWNGDVTRCLNALKKTPFVMWEDDVLKLDAELVAVNLDLKNGFGLNQKNKIPSLTLGRSDGTTLYTTRDIPYTIWKFKESDKVVNVIGMEQNLSQLQLKLALSAIGYLEEAKNLVHFSYNLIRFPDQRMSGRRGRYVTFDHVMEESVIRAYSEVSKRSPQLAEKEKKSISETVGIGAVKYALVETDTQKPVVFTWKKVLNFETNSAPYIQYSHARASKILRRARRSTGNFDCSVLKEPVERDLVLMISRFPEVFIDAADNLKPSTIADYSNALADKFNTFYAAVPVIKAHSPELIKARLALVKAVMITLRNALDLIGIRAPTQM